MSFITNNWRSRLGTMFPSLTEFAEDPSSPPDRLEPVLVLDDDAEWAKDCGATLGGLGYEALIASDLDQAAGLLLSHPVSIVIVEYNMPGREASSAASELARLAEGHGRKLNFIFVTAHATKEVALSALRASAVDLLEKPFRKAELRKTLQRIEGVDGSPEIRDTLLQTMGSLTTALQRLSMLVDEPDRAAERRSQQPKTPALPEEACEPPSCSALARHIRDLLKNEARRRQIGGGDVFGDPAWEMLLDLLLAKMEARRVSVSSACIASGAPMSTALRLVGRLVDEGVLEKVPDETDRRRHFLMMNPAFEEMLHAYLSDQAAKAG